MKIIFIGAVRIGHTILEAIYKTGETVEVVYTLPHNAEKKTSGFVDFAPIAEKHASLLIRTSDTNRPEHRE
ncbi:MAG: methionyl-tRNA formyltransferase, partial [bacterium]